MKLNSTASIEFAIVNEHGNLWCDKLFSHPQDAVEYFKLFWGKGWQEEISKLKITGVVRQVTILDDSDLVSLLAIEKGI